MWISKKTRYGLRLIVELSQNYGTLTTLKEISNNEALSGKYLEQIVTDLRKANMVEAVRGPKGGYRLIVDPSQITLKDVLDIFDGNEAIVECLTDRLLCERSNICKSRVLWETANRLINEALMSINISMIINSSEPNNPERRCNDNE